MANFFADLERWLSSIFRTLRIMSNKDYSVVPKWKMCVRTLSTLYNVQGTLGCVKSYDTQVEVKKIVPCFASRGWTANLALASYQKGRAEDQFLIQQKSFKIGAHVLLIYLLHLIGTGSFPHSPGGFQGSPRIQLWEVFVCVKGMRGRAPSVGRRDGWRCHPGNRPKHDESFL